MANYYEILKLQPAATIAEIQTAWEDQYNQWRRLVTHHDPNIANQASQALQVLEMIRTTLTDPSKRAGYDAGIGLSSVSGLADPEALLRMSAPRATTLPPPKTSYAPAAESQGLWACPKCATNNPEHTQYCLKCGAQLVRECPKCKSTSSLVSTGFCGKCGASYEALMKRNGLVGQLEQMHTARDALRTEMGQLEERKKSILSAKYNPVVFSIVLSIAVSMMVALCSSSLLLPFLTENLRPIFVWGVIAFTFPFSATILFLIASFANHSTQSRLNTLQPDLEIKERQLASLDAQCQQLEEAIREFD